jgi:3-oxoacyl-[acyl-carrier protein] reductase
MKYALVTGGSRGIGRAIAIAFAKNGADVAIIFAGNEEAAVQTKEISPFYVFDLCFKKF